MTIVEVKGGRPFGFTFDRALSAYANVYWRGLIRELAQNKHLADIQARLRALKSPA